MDEIKELINQVKSIALLPTPTKEDKPEKIAIQPAEPILQPDTSTPFEKPLTMSEL